MKVKDDILIGYYLMGTELMLDDKSFPNWFEFYEEKMACLCGYNDACIGVIKTDNEDILEEIKKKIK